jgi:hypothetical protein
MMIRRALRPKKNERERYQHGTPEILLEHGVDSSSHWRYIRTGNLDTDDTGIAGLSMVFVV